MNSRDYKSIISTIARNTIRKRFPGLQKVYIEEAAKQIAINIHARMYGANVDGVDSPIWRDTNQHEIGSHPKVEAKELLNDE